MDPLSPDPLLRSFEQHPYAKNRSARTVTPTSSPGGKPTPSCAAAALAWRPPPGPTSRHSWPTRPPVSAYHKVLKILYGWLAEEE